LGRKKKNSFTKVLEKAEKGEIRSAEIRGLVQRRKAEETEANEGGRPSLGKKAVN